MDHDAAPKTVDEVREFWESHPLFAGESRHAVGSKEFFDEHRRVCIDDCLAGQMDERFIPPAGNRDRVLDLGCGIGMWTVELAQRGCTHVVGADLTERAVELTRTRCEIYGVAAEVRQENAEQLSFADGTFRHVNCQGVIHHTPDTAACVREIARVLEPGGTASLSVYHKNIFLAAWPVLRHVGRLLSWCGVGMKGRDRERILTAKDAEEIVRMYDGASNPIGRCYSRRQFTELVRPHFHIQELYTHLFPARALPFPVPKSLHRFLDRRFGLLLCSTLRKAE